MKPGAQVMDNFDMVAALVAFAAILPLVVIGLWGK